MRSQQHSTTTTIHPEGIMGSGQEQPQSPSPAENRLIETGGQQMRGQECNVGNRDHGGVQLIVMYHRGRRRWWRNGIQSGSSRGKETKE